MSPQVAYATAAHFLRSVAAREPGSALAIYRALSACAAHMGLPEEHEQAERSIKTVEAFDAAQLEFEALIEKHLGGGTP